MMLVSEYVSMLLLLNANCASNVIASASSKIINLIPLLNIVIFSAKPFISSLTVLIPLSSDASNFITLNIYYCLYIIY